MKPLITITPEDLLRTESAEPCAECKEPVGFTRYVIGYQEQRRESTSVRGGDGSGGKGGTGASGAGGAVCTGNRPHSESGVYPDEDRIRMHIEAASREELLELLRKTANSVEHAHQQIDSYAWIETIERICREHNGVMSIDLHFGHDGDRTCRFRDYDGVIASFSCDDMHRSVDECIRAAMSRPRIVYVIGTRDDGEKVRLCERCWLERNAR